MADFQMLPETFEQLRQAVPAGYSISERLLEPFILVSRKGNQIVAQLGGIRTVRGKRHEFLAPSNRHMWIGDGTVMRPLPRDATQAMFGKIGDLDPDNLPFSAAVRLLRDNDDSIAASPAVNLLVAGKDAADLQAENITNTGFDLVFRTWEETQVARVRASWQAVGELSNEDTWDI